MWTYKQSTGELFHTDSENDETLIGKGYSGAGESKNDPQSQVIHNEGPIPQGVYNILEPRDTEKHGPYVMPLAPDPANQMFGRDGFLIHGDAVHAPGTASQGCVILAHPIRQQIWDSGDHQLMVIA